MWKQLTSHQSLQEVALTLEHTLRQIVEIVNAITNPFRNGRCELTWRIKENPLALIIHAQRYDK